MEPRISLITLGVTDLDRAVRFYQTLGWVRWMKVTEGVAFFQAGGMVLGLYPWDALAEDAGVGPGGSGFRGISLAHNTRTRDEADTVLAEAAAAGGTIVKPAKEAFWGGYSGYFADPDGHLWEVAWNPGFEILDDGSVRLPG